MGNSSCDHEARSRLPSFPDLLLPFATLVGLYQPLLFQFFSRTNHILPPHLLGLGHPLAIKAPGITTAERL